MTSKLREDHAYAVQLAESQCSYRVNREGKKEISAGLKMATRKSHALHDGHNTRQPQSGRNTFPGLRIQPRDQLWVRSRGFQFGKRRRSDNGNHLRATS